MIIQRFEDIIAWQKAQDVAVHIHLLFKDNKDFSFKDQLSRAVISISNNIAEGFDRSSDADFVRFLYIATGSASEVRSMLYLAKGLITLQRKRKLLFLKNLMRYQRLFTA